MAAIVVPGLEHERRRSEEHTSELQSRFDLVCRLLLEKKKINELNIYAQLAFGRHNCSAAGLSRHSFLNFTHLAQRTGSNSAPRFSRQHPRLATSAFTI